MRFIQVAALAGVGLTQAFLIPPAISSEASKLIKVASFELGAALEGRVMEVDCPRCPVAGAKSQMYHAESVLRFNVSVQHGNDEPDKLMVNGVQLFPIETTSTSESLVADQHVKKPDGTWGYSSSPELGYSMSVKPFHDGKERLSIYGIHLRIIEVGTTFVRGIPAIELKVLKTPSGKLMIASSDIKGDRISNKPHEPQCPSLLCHWKAAIANKVDALKKGCGSKNGGHRRPRPHGAEGGRRPHHEGSGGRPHPHHRRPHRPTFAGFFRSFVLHVIVPICIGVTLGITASLIGMVVGHTAIFFWRLFFRRGERGEYCRVKQEETVEETDEEGKSFLENQSPSPVYEDAVAVEDEKTEQV